MGHSSLLYDYLYDFQQATTATENIILVALLIVFLIIGFWVNLATITKRFHDRNKSGWWTALAFVPLIGTLWILVECGFLKGSRGDNKYGPDLISYH